jgi:hypothetical protein
MKNFDARENAMAMTQWKCEDESAMRRGIKKLFRAIADEPPARIPIVLPAPVRIPPGTAAPASAPVYYGRNPQTGVPIPMTRGPAVLPDSPPPAEELPALEVRNTITVRKPLIFKTRP